MYAPSPNVCCSEMYAPFWAQKMYAPVGILEKIPFSFHRTFPFYLEKNEFLFNIFLRNLPFFCIKMPFYFEKIVFRKNGLFFGKKCPFLYFPLGNTNWYFFFIKICLFLLEKITLSFRKQNIGQSQNCMLRKWNVCSSQLSAQFWDFFQVCSGKISHLPKWSICGHYAIPNQDTLPEGSAQSRSADFVRWS